MALFSIFFFLFFHRTMLPFFSNLLPQIPLRQHQLISLFLELNVDIQSMLREYAPKYGYMCVPEPQYSQLVTKGLQMAQVHVQLRDYFATEETPLFNMTSKTHFCIHSFLLSNSIHPSVTWCFKGEETMRAVQTLMKSCLAGNKHWGATKVASLKYRHLLHLRKKMLKLEEVFWNSSWPKSSSPKHCVATCSSKWEPCLPEYVCFSVSPKSFFLRLSFLCAYT